MGYISSTDRRFVGKLEDWLRAQPEILVLIRYSRAAGAKDWEFFVSFEALSDRLRRLPSQTCIIAFRQPQLPLRGVVDDRFIAQCLERLPDGSEFLVLETVRREESNYFYWRAGESHAELREVLEELRGSPVAAGLYPPWLEDTDDVISAVVPDADRSVTVGVY